MSDLTNEEKIRILSRGLKAALRWPYQLDMLTHVADPSTARGQNYDDSYLADVREMHAALNVANSGGAA